MSSEDTPKWMRGLGLAVLGIGAFLIWTAVKWVVRIYMIVWLEGLGVPPGVSWVIAFGTVAAILFAAAYFLKPWFDRLTKDDETKDT